MALFAPEWPEEMQDWAYSGSIRISSDQMPIPRIVQWVLGDYLGSKDGGRWEKTAWRYWFTFREKPFSLAFEKFGLRLYGSAASEDAFKALGEDLLKQLDKAVRIAESQVFQTVADAQIRAGNVTIRNQYHRLRRMYEKFRRIAEESAPKEEPTPDGTHRPVRFLAEDEHRFHYTVAMLNAYFGWIEHVLVLCWPFCGYKPRVDDLETFIGDKWGEKFKKLFDPSKDAQANRFRSQLKEIADDFRNTFDHGGFGRHRRGILVHVPGGSPIEAGLSEVRKRPHFEFYPVPEDSLADIVGLLDEVDEWLRTGPAEFGMRWAEGGLDVPFDPEHVEMIRLAMDSEDDDFDQLMERCAYFSDQAANMDW
jgi:hypothetical protein